MNSKYELITKRRFLPLFITQFFGGFNDNFLRFALGALVTYKISDSDLFASAEILMPLAATLLILPYVLFSALAGQIADKFERSKLVHFTKYFELFIVIVAAVGFWTYDIRILLGCIFLLGTQSAFFSPMKYSLLPDQLKKGELITGNGLLEGGTFVAILLGSVLGTQLGDMMDIGEEMRSLYVSVPLICFSLIGIFAAHQIPKAEIGSKNLKITKNPISGAIETVRRIKADPKLFGTILGTSWFWFLGVVFQANLITFAEDVVNVNADVATLFFVIFAVGVAIGSVVCAKMLGSEISARYAPMALIGFTLGTYLLLFATATAPTKMFGMLDPGDFFTTLSGSLIGLSIFIVSFSAGVYVVPLKAMVQHKAEKKSRSRVIAGENIINATFMLIAGITSMALLKMGLGITGLFFIIATINIFVAFLVIVLLPETLMQTALKWLFKLMFRVEVRGIENFKKAGDKVVIVPNHQSFLDPPLLSAFLPRKPNFAINTQISQLWFVRPFLFMFGIFKMDPTNPMAMKSLIEFVKEGRRIVIFPEGRITVTGSLMKVYEGPGLIADKAGATLLPIRIEGAQYSIMSRLKGKVKRKIFPKITITILPPVKLNPKSTNAKERRAEINQILERMMSDSMFEATDYKRPLIASVLESAKIHGKKKIIAEDINRKGMSYKKLFLKTIVLGNALKKIKGKNVGVLLPNALANLVTFFALHYANKTPAMINFSAGVKNVNAAIETAEIKTILTSKLFIKKAELGDLIDGIKKTEIIYLEDLAKKIGFVSKIKGVLVSKAPNMAFRKAVKTNPNDAAVILFTSGSEGVPKGVVLSHANIQSNISQADSVIDFSNRDIVLNVLPMFHSFGLTVGTLLPVTRGIKVFLYPSPLHYNIIPEISYAIQATMLFGTDTFLSRYGEAATPYDFFSVRYVFAGAEKLKDSTYELWQNKFGIRIFQGYGVTETSPFLSANSPMQNKVGSIGKIIPGVEYKIKPVDGIEEGGELWVKGPNIMLGYLKHDKPGKLQPPKNGWYQTGDIVTEDEDGFLFIQGRAKRFAKVAGEMVSLPAVEDAIAKAWSEPTFVVAVNDAKKGEQLVLVTERKKAKLPEAKQAIKDAGLPSVAQPKQIIEMEIPLLGSGKTDFAGLQKAVNEKLA